MRAMRLDLNSISLIDINGDTIEAELKAMQQAVGGYIETVRLKDGGVMLVDEEGMLKQYPRNELASILSSHHIYGTALIVGQSGDRLTDVPEKYLALLEIGEV